MIWFIKKCVRASLVATAMATAVSTVTFAQPNEPAMESVPTADTAATRDASPVTDEQSTDANVSTAIEPTAKPTIPDAAEVDIQRRFNELRGELLDDRAAYIDRWLIAVSIVLAFFGIVAVVGGYMGFRRFREIETEAKNSVKTVTDYAETAERRVGEIEKNRDKLDEFLRDISAKTAADNPEEAKQAINPEEAKQAIEDVRKNPKASLTDKAIAEALSLQEQGKREEALKIWRGIADTFEEVDRDLAAGAHFSVGYLLFQQGKHEDSITAYDEAIRLKPNDAGAYINRGNTKHALRRYAEAIADYDEAIRLEADLAVAYNNRGNAKHMLGRHAEAIADHDEAIRLETDYAIAYSSRGNAKAALGRREEAIADYDEAIRLEADYAVAYNNRGNAKAALGRREEAIADYDEAIRLEADYAEAYSNRGEAKAVLGRHNAAIADYDEAIRRKPDLAETYGYRGEAKAALGLNDEARQDFEKVRDLARKAGNDSLVALAEQGLRDLDNREGE